MTTKDIIDLIKHSEYKPEVSRQLHDYYDEDPDGLKSVCDVLLKQGHVYALFVLSVIMTRENKSRPELEQEQLRDLVINVWEDINDYTPEFRVNDILKDRNTRINGNVFQFSRLHFRDVNLIACACLYDYSDEVYWLYDFLFKNVIQFNDPYNFSYLYDCLLVAQVQYNQRSPLEMTRKLLDAGVINYEMVFRSYTFDLRWGDSVHLNSQMIVELVKDAPDEALALLDKIFDDDKDIITRWINMLYVIAGLDDYKPLLAYLGHKDPAIRDLVGILLFPKEKEIRGKVETIIPSSTAEALNIQKLLVKWDDVRYKDDKIFENGEQLIAFCEKNIREKKCPVSWIPCELWDTVKLTNGEPAPEAAQFIVYHLLQFSEPGRSYICDRVADRLDKSTLALMLDHLYSLWIKADCDPGFRMIVLPYVLYGPAHAVNRLKEQVDDFYINSQAGIASLLIETIALNEHPASWAWIGNMALYKGATSAIRTFSRIARERGVHEDELSDRIIPDLGLDADGMMELECGHLRLKMRITSGFDLVFIDQHGKVARNISAITAGIDKKVIENTRKEYQGLKKQLQEILRVQGIGLMKALMNGRGWGQDLWHEIFMKHPIMKHFTSKLVWGVYLDDKLLSTFSYSKTRGMYSLEPMHIPWPAKALIKLAHPVDAGERLMNQWYQLLPYNENVSMIRHLALSSGILEEQDLDGNRIIRYSGRIISKEIDITRIIDTRYYSTTVFWDIYGIYFRDKYLDIEVILKSRTLSYTSKDNLFYELVFYPYSLREKYRYEQITDSLTLDPRTLPKRFVNSVLAICDSLFETNFKCVDLYS